MKHAILLAILLIACEPTTVEINLFWQDVDGTYSTCNSAGVDSMAHTTYYWDYDNDYHDDYYYSDYYDDYYWDSESSKIIPCRDKIILDTTYKEEYSVVVSGYYRDSSGIVIGWQGECYGPTTKYNYYRYDCLIPMVY